MSATHAHGASLDPLGFPLRGRHLIEASAGTGKTYTIAALYVRLVLGHGTVPEDGSAGDTGNTGDRGDAGDGGPGFPRALMPPEILVVTFTDAATKELRERIRARLAQAAAFFRADPARAQASGDDFLDRLRAGEPAERWPAHARALELAAEWMDEAAVSTIHAWCKRMLVEHAFDSGSLFTQTLETDQREQLAEVVRDYWRSFMLPLAAAEAAEVAQWWPAPEPLGEAAGKLLAHLDALPAADEPAVELGRSLTARAAALAALKAPWGAWADSLQALFDAAVAAKAVDGRVIQPRRYQPWFDALRSWAADPAALLPALTESALSRLTPEGLAAGWKSGTPPDHPALVALAELPGRIAALPDARAAVTVHAARWIAVRFAEAQRRRASMGFDDLLRQLDAALAGPQGAVLARRIRAAFPVALIDEFQDTDPVQYRIFDAVYRPRPAEGETRAGDGEGETALILIGDPKQAIYAFRGADIHTYLAARRDCAGRLHTLQRNFRSSHAMVEAVNRCFRHAELRTEGAGAFLFRDAHDNPVPFIDAVANGRADRFLIDGMVPAALTLWWLPPTTPDKALAKAEYLERMAAGCASELVRLLALGQAGRAGFARAGAFTPLRPADVAVLVNNRSEAQAIRAALAARGVRSVYLSDRDSVFDSPQAGDVQHWLAACAEPEDGRLLRAALATATLALDWSALDRIGHDELAWEAHVERFRRYRDIWRRQGVLPMLRRLLHDYEVPARCLAPAAAAAGRVERAGGERVLTDVLHLAELLQQAAATLDGEHALIRHLAEQRASPGGPGGSGDARQLRLESDAGLVQVVTVHKSKGLEYPLVFLPFAATAREVGPKDVPIKFHDAAGRLQLVLQPDEGARTIADRERLGEDLRKLYVALTRARHACWAGVAPTAELARSAFGYLLDAAGEIAPDGLEARLLDLAGDCAAIRVAPAPAPAPEAVRLAQHDAEDRPYPARSPRRIVREHWWVASYSALRHDAADGSAVRHSARVAPDTAGEDVFQDSAQAPVVPVPASLTAAPRRPPPGSLHALPRGAEIGTFLHDLLESAAVGGFAAVAAQPALLRDMIARRAAVRGLEAWINPLAAWLKAFITTPFALPGVGGCDAAPLVLTGLEAAVPELEFWLPVQALDSRVIDRLVCAHTLDGAARPVLLEDRLNGMLKGFIDLVFEHDGRYYVADYKSNALGADDAAYTPEAMRDAILGHRYELQYVLYLLALHRLLRSRLPDYDYDRHVGGAVYLFLRGLDAPSQGLHFERPPRVLIEALDRLFSGAAPKEVA